MNPKIVPVFLFVFLSLVGFGQTGNQYIPGTFCTTCPSRANTGLSILNANAGIATSYTASAPGLNYTQSSLHLNQRLFPTGLVGVPQPATFTITGIPNCAIILKAFLYIGTVGDGVAINASITNPANTASVFPATIIGSDISVCWATTGTFSYRADVTSVITGNGNYTISGIPTNAGLPSTIGDDAEGATLFIIYADQTQNYTGNIVIADGCYETYVPFISSTISGFNVCGTPSLTTNFMILSDMQGTANTEIWLNQPANATSNYTKTMVTDQVWDFISAPGAPAVSGQTSADYGLANLGDCIGLMVAGMYYRNSCPVASVIPVNYFSTLTVTAASNPTCPSTATAVASGGSGNYVYLWAGSTQTGSVVTGLSAGVNTVIAYDTTSCAMGTFTLLSAPLPLTLTATANANCPASATVTPMNPGAYTYTWSGSAQTGSIASGLTSGVYTIQAKSTSGCISEGSVTLQVQTVATPLGFSVSGPVCPGVSTVTISLGPAQSYTWDPTFSPLQINSSSVSVSPTINTTYTVSHTNYLGCIGSQTVAVNILTTIPPINYNVSNYSCPGINVTVSAGPALSYTWSPGFSPPQINSLSISVTPTANTIYTLAYTNNQGCIGSQTVPVNVLPTQSFYIGNYNFCEGATMTITPSIPAQSSSWTGPNNYTSTQSLLTFTNAAPSLSGVYSVTIITQAGCTFTSSTNVNIIATPIPTLTSNSPICSNVALTLSASGGATAYYWQGPNNFAGNAQNETLAGAISGIYTLTATFGNLCNQTNTLFAVINPTPTVSLSSNSPVCENGQLTLFANGGTSYQWAGPNGFNSAVQNPSITGLTAAASGIYTVIVSLSGCSVSSVQAVTVNPVPIVSPGSNSPVCVGDTLKLSSGASGGQFYVWIGPNAFASNQPNPFILQTQLPNSGAYTVVVTGANGCSQASVINVPVLSNPVVSATGTVACYGAQVTIFASGASSYSWSGPGGLNATSSSFLISPLNNLSAGVYSVTGFDQNGCSDNVTVTVAALPLPVLSVSGQTVCEGQSTFLSASGAAVYLWNGPSGFVSTLANPAIPAVTLQNAGNYSVVGTALNTCSNSAIATISVVPMPQPIISASPQVICQGENATLTVSGAQTYSWLPLGSSNAASIVVSPALTANYSVLGSNMGVCNKAASVTVSVSVCMGLEEIQSAEQAVLVYPNPTNGNFTIRTNTPMQISLVDGLGRIIDTYRLSNENNYTVSVSNLAGGIYYVVSAESNIPAQKIIITK